MSQPILSLKADEKVPKAVGNILPCRVHYNGSIESVTDYWSPTTAEDGSKVAYFRGRKLQGKAIKLPQKCRGFVVQRNKDDTPNADVIVEGEDGDDSSERVGSMQVVAEFDEMVVWGHETVGDATDDPYIRIMEEWLQVAGQIHSYEESDVTQK